MLNKRILGNTGIEVTELCFGALPVGPLQKNLPDAESADIIAYALESGINFVDTAQAYKTYAPIKAAKEKTNIRPIIASKSAAINYDEMEKAIFEALEGMGIEYIDIFHLHGPKAEADIFELRKGALQCLLDYKSKGIIKAVGVSAHNVKVIEAAALRPELDIVFPIINKSGKGMYGGTVEEMERAIELCSGKGKGVYLMKVLGGGTLIDEYISCMEYARSLKGYQSIAIGMVSREEVAYNVKYFNGEAEPGDIIKIKNKKNVQVLKKVCIACGKCIEVCHSEAICFGDEEKAFIDNRKCIQCGYCIAACPTFSIRIV